VKGARNPRREVAAVAAALLLPVPLLAATGVRLPLPAAVERGLASVTPGSFDAPVSRAAPVPLEAAPAEPSTDGAVQAPSTGEEQASSAFATAPAGGDSPGAGRDGRTDRPQGGATEPSETLPRDTGPGDAPPPPDVPDAPPPPEPDTPPATPAPAETQADAQTELNLGLDAGEVATEVEVGSDGVGVTVSAGDLLPTTTLFIP